MYQPNASEPITPPYSFENTPFGPIVGIYRDELAHFVECLRTGAAPIVTPEQAVSTVKVCEAIERSVAENRPIRIEQQNCYV